MVDESGNTKDSVGYLSVAARSMSLENTRQRDALIKLLLLSKKSNTLDKFVSNITHLKYLFENHTPAVQMFLNNC